MPTTPNRGYPYPATTAPATVPADLEKALSRVDADVQSLVDNLVVSDDLNHLEQAVAAIEDAQTLTAEKLDSKVDDTDSRLTDARTPKAHRHPLADVDGLTARLAALERDTGWRNIIALSPTGVLADDTTSRLRRVGDIVYLEGYGFPGDVLKTVALASAYTFAELPLGFHAAGYVPARGTVSHAYGSPFGTIEFFADRAQPRLNMGGAAVGIYSGFLSWSVEFHTTDPWPTSLPG